MTPQQIADVQRTFALVVPIKEKAASLFYERLFAIDASTKPLFKGDLTEQGKKLMTALSFVVAGLVDLPKIVPVVENLARRHVEYGVEEKQYDSVGAALLWTLEQGLGEHFTAPVREAWASAYGILATTMKAAARELTKKGYVAA